MILRRGTLALMMRSWRMQSRAWGTYLVRGALTGLIFLGLIGTYSESEFVGAPGLALFGWIIFPTLGLVTLAGTSYFATVISEERDLRTLGLLRMTELNSISIILGKSATRVMTTMSLLIATFPFTLMAITLGGVGLAQIVAAYCTLLAYTLGLGGFALLWSVLCVRSRSASAIVVMSLLLFFIGPPLGGVLLGVWTRNGSLAADGQVAIWAGKVFEWGSAASPLNRLIEIIEGGFSSLMMGTTPSAGAALTLDVVLNFQVISNVAAGSVFFLLAWLAFEHLHRDELAAGESSPKSPSAKRLARRRRTRRAWSAAVLWKDYRYIGGGTPGFIARVLLYAVVVGGILTLIILERRGTRLDDEMLSGTMIWTALAGLILETSLMAGHIFRDEIRWQTLSAIMILPTSLPKLVYAKIAGCLLSLVPAAALFILGFMLAPPSIYRDVEDVLDEPGFWLIASIAVLFVHLVAFLSLYMKWGALAGAVAAMFVGFMMTGIAMSTLSFVYRSRTFEETLTVIGTLALLGLSVLLQLLCGRKLRQIASQ